MSVAPSTSSANPASVGRGEGMMKAIKQGLCFLGGALYASLIWLMCQFWGNTVLWIWCGIGIFVVTLIIIFAVGTFLADHWGEA